MTISRQMRHRITSILLFIPLLLGVGFSILPVVWTILSSFKLEKDIMVMPPRLIFEPTFTNYAQALTRGNFSLSLYNSVVVALGTTLLSLAVGSLCAYSLSRFRFAGNTELAFFMLLTRMFPPMLTALPLFLIFQRLRLVDTHLALIIANSTFSMPFVVWLMRGFFMSIPTELDEAGMVDGCTRMGAFWRVILPLVGPGMAATAVFTLLSAWNEFFMALILTRFRAATMPLLISGFVMQDDLIWGPINAVATLFIVPVLLMTLFLQRYLT